eukprot:12522378-Ditylum_brightwellii.AAC.1
MSNIHRDTGRKEKRKGKDKQKGVRHKLLGWDNSRCQKYEKEECNKRNGIAEYYRDQSPICPIYLPPQT